MFMDWAAARNISVWLDVHTARGSQNGFDNGGRAQIIEWKDETHFSHDDEVPYWLGSKGRIDFAHIKWSLDQVEAMLQRWGSHSALIAFEPVNEPGDETNLNVLKNFYREARKMVRQYSPQSYFVFHESFRDHWKHWSDLFAEGDTEMTAVDHHGYFAWEDDLKTVEQACDFLKKDA